MAISRSTPVSLRSAMRCAVPMEAGSDKGRPVHRPFRAEDGSALKDACGEASEKA